MISTFFFSYLFIFPIFQDLFISTVSLLFYDLNRNEIFTRYIALTTKRLLSEALPPNDKIRNHFVANLIEPMAIL